MFIRIKRVKGQDYGYLVENTWTGKGARQKVTGYLGRIMRPERAKSESLQGFLKLEDAGKYVRGADYREIVKQLIILELLNHDLDGKIDVDFEKVSVGKGGKNIVAAMNDGFLCNHTLKRLIEYVPDEDYSGFLLADLITSAGIKVEKDVFVGMFEKLQRKQEQKAAEKMDFYY